jgi:uncharacterized protein (DUF2147 family)
MNYLLTSCFIVLTVTVASAQQYADAITGKWKSEDKKTVVEIYRQGDVFYGKIVWQANPNDANGNPRKDTENPDPAKRNRPMMGLVVLYDLVYKDGFWQDGEIYNAQNGETYDAEVWLEGNDKLRLKIRWYFMHETQTWTRVI